MESLLKRYPATMSAILSADDLNDFISPGVACIKPVESLPKSAKEPKVCIPSAFVIWLLTDLF